MRSVPPHWKLCKLGDVIRLKNGYAFKSNDYTEDGIPLIRISDINDNKVTVESAVRIPREKANADFYIESGDLLIAMSGATTGKTGVYNGQAPILQNQRVGNFKIIDENIVDKRYRNYYVTSLRKDIEKAAYGGAQPNISSKGIESFDFPLAPLNEQNLIVSEIEKQFSRLDEAVAALKRVRASLKRYKASVLKAAVEGKLTEEWRKENPNVEPADKLLERIKKERSLRGAERRSKLRGKEEIASPLARNDNLPELPKGWVWATVGQISESMKNGIYKPRDSYSANGVACLRMYNIEDGRIVWKNIKRMTLSKGEIKEYKLLPGDLLVNRVNSRELVGKAAPILEGLESCVFESKNIRVRFQNEFIDTNFVSYIFSVYGQAFFNRNAQQVVGMASISQPQVSTLPVPLCSFTEQKSIVEEVERCLSVTEEIEKTVKINLKRAERLRQAILKKAFSGRLVRQDNKINYKEAYHYAK